MTVPFWLRLGWIYFFVLVVMTGGGYYLGGIENQLVNGCRATAVSNTAFNKTLDALLTNAATSTMLTPAQKAQRVAQYAPLHLPIVPCPHHVF